MRPYPLSAADVSATVRATLQEFLPAQLLDSPRPLPQPTTYEEAPTAEAIRRVHGSTLAVVTPGLRSKERFADGHELTWGVVVVVWHQSSVAMPLLSAGGDYNAAVRRVLTDHCPPLAQSVEYETESWDLVGDALSDRTLGMSMCEFIVRTGDTLLYTPPVPGLPDTSGPVVLTTEVIHNP